ncbi:MAG: 2-oxoacid:acceptor oxidoreductase subunit alpha [Nitrospinae bacterium]|nr:2-oxoacid:acceptor oxidoreductase subunit alpha [Nitrospinota bacterium]
MRNELTITIGGSAGQGLVTISHLLLTSLARMGYHVFASQDYMSRVRGGHNFMRIHVARSQPRSAPNHTNVLMALDGKSVETHSPSLLDPAVVILDPATVKARPSNGARVIEVPISFIAKEKGSARYENSVALGALFATLDLPLDGLGQIFEEQFAKKDSKVRESNTACALAGFEAVKQSYPQALAPLWREDGKGRYLLNGASGIGLGLIAAGLRFITAYPMSPSTGIFTYITNQARKLGIVSEQAEDEVAALNMAIGASSCGARSATTTSGGGLALMSEAVSLAAITETPVTIANIMRPGPATGLPTRTGQEDLDFVLSIGHGEFPRFVFAPGSADEAFYTAATAMNLSEKYQVPSFILGDQHLVDSYITVDSLDTAKAFPINQLIDPQKVEKPYLRYKLTEDGVSPRAVHGMPGIRFITDSHVHEENGHITEDPEISMKMAEKRFAKLVGMNKEKAGLPAWHGPKNADIVFVCFGSVAGAVRDTVDKLNAAGKKTAALCFNRVAPFPTEAAKKLLRGKKKIHVVENNIQGQFERLLKSNTGVKTGEPVRRYDGRPFDTGYIIDRIKRRHKWRI